MQLKVLWILITADNGNNSLFFFKKEIIKYGTASIVWKCTNLLHLQKIKKNKKNEDKHESDKKFIKSEIISIIQKIERCWT